MARGVVRIGQWLAALTAVLALGACSSTANGPTLEWTAFDGADCPDGSDAATCFVLRAEVDGTGRGDGRCDVYAVGGDGANLVTGATVGPLALRSGRSFEWLVELPRVDDPSFDEWVPECFPPAEGQRRPVL